MRTCSCDVVICDELRDYDGKKKERLSDKNVEKKIFFSGNEQRD